MLLNSNTPTAHLKRLTKTIVEDYLNELRAASEDDEHAYEISSTSGTYAHEYDDGGLHYFFTHEQWMDQHQCPLCLPLKVPDASYQQDDDVLEIVKSILGVHDPVSMTTEDRARASRAGEFFETPEDLLVQAYQSLPED